MGVDGCVVGLVCESGRECRVGGEAVFGKGGRGVTGVGKEAVQGGS